MDYIENIQEMHIGIQQKQDDRDNDDENNDEIIDDTIDDDDLGDDSIQLNEP